MSNGVLKLIVWSGLDWIVGFLGTAAAAALKQVVQLMEISFL